MNRSRFYTRIIIYLFSLIIALVLLSSITSSISFENLALGENTTSYWAKNKNGNTIHFQKIDASLLKKISSLQITKEDSVLLFLGNSQTHGINQFKSSYCNYVEAICKTTNHKILAFSYPNANLQELYITFLYCLNNYNVKQVFIPIFLDDLRETGIREFYFSSLYNEEFYFSRYPVRRELLISVNNNKSSTLDAFKTPQDISENYLNAKLDSSLFIWQNRANIRGLIYNFLYKLRNTIFHITPNTVRSKMVENYNLNLFSLKWIIETAKFSQTKLFIYIPPLRSDLPSPYDPIEYTQFLNDLKIICKDNSDIIVKDFSQIIPPEFWGFKESTNFIDDQEVDFMHFNFFGHKILADSLRKYILNDF